MSRDYSEKIGDTYGDTLAVGTEVRTADGEAGTVSKILDSNDMEGGNPRVFVDFADGATEEYHAENQQTWYTDELAFRVHDLILA